MPKPLHIDEPPGTEVEVSSSEVQFAWKEGDDLILVYGYAANGSYPELAMERQVGCRDSVAIVLDTIDGKEPNITTHEGYRSAVAEGKDLKGFEPNGLLFVEVRPDLEGPAILMEFAAEFIAMPVDLLCYLTYAKAGAMAEPRKNAGPTALKPIGHEVAYLTASPEHEPARAQVEPRRKDDCVPSILPIDDDVARASLESAGKTPASRAEQEKTAVAGTKDGAGSLFEGLELEIARKLGFNGVQRIIARWGFQDRALLSVVRIETPTPRKGVFTLFDQPDFQADRLPVIPTDASSFVLASFEPEASYRKFVEAIKACTPDAAAVFDAFESMTVTEVGLRLRADLLRHVGPTWAVVDIPAKDHGTDMVLVASVDDPDALDRIAGELGQRFDEQVRPGLEAYLKDQLKKAGRDTEIGTYGLTKLPAPDRGYRISFPPISVRFEDGEDEDDDFRCFPSNEATRSLYLLIGKSSVALSPDLEPARRVLAAQTGPWKPAGTLTTAFDGLPANLTYLSVTDPARCSLPEANAAIPGTARTILTGSGMATLPEELEVLPEPLLNYLEFFGLIPHPDMPIIRLEPSETAKPDDVRPLIFPSILATSVDDRGYRIIRRQPFPLAGLFSEIAIHQGWSLKWKGLRIPEIRYNITASSPRFGSTRMR